MESQAHLSFASEYLRLRISSICEYKLILDRIQNQKYNRLNLSLFKKTTRLQSCWLGVQHVMSS